VRRRGLRLSEVLLAQNQKNRGRGASVGMRVWGGSPCAAVPPTWSQEDVNELGMNGMNRIAEQTLLENEPR
jgi:hypothetical protein